MHVHPRYSVGILHCPEKGHNSNCQADDHEPPTFALDKTCPGPSSFWVCVALNRARFPTDSVHPWTVKRPYAEVQDSGLWIDPGNVYVGVVADWLAAVQLIKQLPLSMDTAVCKYGRSSVLFICLCNRLCTRFVTEQTFPPICNTCGCVLYMGILWLNTVTVILPYLGSTPDLEYLSLPSCTVCMLRGIGTQCVLYDLLVLRFWKVDSRVSLVMSESKDAYHWRNAGFGFLWFIFFLISEPDSCF